MQIAATVGSLGSDWIFPAVLQLGTCVMAKPRAAIAFSVPVKENCGGVVVEDVEQVEGEEEVVCREKEQHPWLFTKHSLFYLRVAVRGLLSPTHLSLISDKALFKRLLF